MQARSGRRPAAHLPGVDRLWCLPLQPKLGDRRTTNASYLPVETPHQNQLNYLFADGHAKLSRWDKLAWGNLDPFITDNDPDYNVSLMKLPSKTRPGM